jgi:hypothetical protein
MRHHRGAPKGNAREAAALRSWLVKKDYAGAESGRLTAPLTLVLGELQQAVAAIHERGLRSVLPSYTESTLRKALSEAGLR